MRVEIELPPKLIPVFLGPARYRGAYGGRGSGKSRSFAKMAAVYAYRAAQAGRSGIVLCVREFMNTLADSSMAEVKAAIESEPWLRPWFTIGESFIRTICGKVEFAFIGLARNLNNVKSKANILLCLADEADDLSEEAWEILIPTVREHDSEIWVVWNPGKRGSPTDRRFRHNTEPDVKIVEINYRDNPWFPEVLERERQADQRNRPDSYEHIWEGDYKTFVEGAYYAEHIAEAKRNDRTECDIARDPLLITRAYCDIGGVTDNADAFTMWIVQFAGRQIRVLDYYEARGQELSEHVHWLRSRGYANATIFLPHDGKAERGAYRGNTWVQSFKEADFNATTIIGPGSGGRMAALVRIEAGRRMFPSTLFDKKAQAGLDRLAAYHERRDEKLGIGLGPRHDQASHGADAFGLMAVAAAEEMRFESDWDEDDARDARGRNVSTGY